MKTLYLDIFSGISGDMFLGALIDLGVDAQLIERDLQRLNLDGYHLHVGRGEKSGIVGVKFDVHPDGAHSPGHKDQREHDRDHGHDHGHRHHGHSHSHSDRHGHEREHGRTFAEIRELILRSALSDWVKQKSLAVFQRIADAEGRIHGQPPEQVHFHEVGAVDSIIDIVGACIALELLGKPTLRAAAPVEGTGWIQCAHGRFPIPAPATLAILGARGVPLTQCEEPNELITPTGAALLAELVESFGPMQGLVAEKIGFGIGTRTNQTRPNVLRAVLGRAASPNGPGSNLDWESDTIAVLETNLDDISSEILGHFVETAFAAGALDVFHTPIQMKKNRPGVLLTVLCAEGQADQFTELLLRETTALGVRRRIAERRKLRREFITVTTKFGEVTVKLGRLNGEVIQANPEYESCRKVAEQARVPIKEVYEAAMRATESVR